MESENQNGSMRNRRPYDSSIRSSTSSLEPAENGLNQDRDDAPYAEEDASLFSFLWSELCRGYRPTDDPVGYVEKSKNIYALLRIPRELESFLFCGLLQCIDAFLYVFTLLPLRFVMAVVHVTLSGFRPSPSERRDLLKVFIIVASVLLMTFIDTSVLYHIVRGQAVVKLYIFFNMLEVADKLFSSFGQDVLDALFWTAAEGSRTAGAPFLRLMLHVAVAIVYVWLHAVLVLLQATTLNVAFNSHNKALLTIMMSNNFVELKGSVFKKFAKNNLFQMACSDVRERFHYVILLLVVIIRNMSAVNWQLDHLYNMLPDLTLVFVAEIFVDWIKHSFITKFNEIPADVYKDFTITIAYDVAKSRHGNAPSDHLDQVSRRMGFIPLPLSVLLIRVLTQSVGVTLDSHWLLLTNAFVMLLLLKLVISVVLMGKACFFIEAYEEMQKHGELLKKLCLKKAHSLPVSPKLSLIEFTDVMQQNTATNLSQCITMTDLLQRGYDQWLNDFIGSGQALHGQDASTMVEPEFTIGDTVVRKSRSMNSLSSSSKNISVKPEQMIDELTDFEELSEVNRYTLVNDDRIES